MPRYDEDEKRPFNLRVWKKLFPFLRPYKGYLIFLVAAQLLCAAIDISYPLFQRYAIDEFIRDGNVENVPAFTGVYLAVLVFQVLLVIGFCRAAMRIEMSLGRDLKQKTFVHLQTLSFSYYNTTPVGYILARTMSDTNRIGGLVGWSLQDMLWALAYVLGVFISMLVLNWKMALLVISVVPFIAVLTVVFQRRILNLNRRIRRINSVMTGAFNEGITGARTSKTLVIEDQNAAGFREISADMYRASVRATSLNALYIPIVLFFSSLASAFVLARGGYMVTQSLMDFGTLSAFISYAINIFEPIQQIARIIADVISAQANIERVTEMLETKPTIVDTPEVIEKYGGTFSPKKENWEPIRGDIEFRDVTFKYPDGNEYILAHFNLKIPAGTTVAIVGETGAGKSTLVNIACRFFEPTEGQVLIDGRDYRERSQLWLHSSLGYVLQNPHLFSGTVRENIRYGRLDATDEGIEAAAKTVSAHELILAMENGYDSDVGESGDRLSTGEKQLISFARAVLADPRIFVLDEATSSIDTRTEQLIQDAISHLLKNRTSFLIAHRLSTIRKADLILVVRGGKIIERGTHEELLAARGYYYTLYRNQFEQELSEEKLR